MSPDERQYLRLTIHYAIAFALVVFFCAVFVKSCYGSQSELAVADRARYCGESDYIYVYYLTVAGELPEQREKVIETTNFVVASCSNAVVLERQLPVRVSETLLRIDLRRLNWHVTDWHSVIIKHPYSSHDVQRKSVPLIVSARWLCVTLLDAKASDAYYRLLYSSHESPAKVPANAQEFFDFWQVSDKQRFRTGLVEGKSGVSANASHMRWIEQRGITTTSGVGYAWFTVDYLKIAKGSDPTETFDGTTQGDGSEYIIGFPKQVKTAAGLRTFATAQAYLLSGGDGQRADVAPVDLVHGGNFRGLPEIRNFGSCVSCHGQGLNGASSNVFLAAVLDAEGVETYTKDYDRAELIEQLNLTDTGAALLRAREDYAAFVWGCNGLEPEANARQCMAVVDAYDADVTLDTAAAELLTTPEELKLALAYASDNGVKLGFQLAALAHGRAMSRGVWEGLYLDARTYLSDWRGLEK